MTNIKLMTMTLLLMFVGVTSADEILSVVSGKVSDIDTGETLPFAKVRIKDTNRVSTANQDGLFTILDVPLDSTLVITKMGFENNEIKVSPNTQRLIINLSKFEKDNLIEEVIVTAARSQKMHQSGISQFSLSPELTTLYQIWVSRTSFDRCSYYQECLVQTKVHQDLWLGGVLSIKI